MSGSKSKLAAWKEIRVSRADSGLGTKGQGSDAAQARSDAVTA